MNHDNLAIAVYRLMAELPPHKVTTYGDLAAFAGHPHAARIVGGIAHRGPDTLPWHRLVHGDGRLAVGFPGGIEAQAQLLAHDGILCDSISVQNLHIVRWRGPGHE